jgi:uncharacterized membrane protein YfhO
MMIGKRLGNNIYKHCGILTFGLALILSLALFLPVIIENEGVFMYYGDFNVQEIPFYQMVHDHVRDGLLGWSHTTDLGSATVSSYSFYLIGSPFFWATIPFPGEWVPFMMGPLFMLKFAFAAFTSYIYIKRYVRNRLFAVAGGLMYAFSGFSIYNIFFFHFHEPMIAFPLLLWAVDRFMYDNKKGALAPVVFFCCIVNYYFFAGMAVFTAIYWLLLVFTGRYRLTVSKTLLFFFEIILGVCATAFVILPTILSIAGNPRLESLPDGYNSIVHEHPQRYWYIALSFFFPPEMPAQPNFAPGVEANWASVSGWLPLAGMTGVIGYLQLKKRDWIKKLIVISIIMAFVPVLNSMFQLLNSSIYYARWFYMPVLILALATVRSLEDKRVDWNRAFLWSTAVTAGIAVITGVMPNSVYDDNDNLERVDVGVMEYIARYWVYVGIAMVSLLMFALIVKRYRTGTKRLALAAICGICVITLLSSTYIVQTGNSLDAEDTPFIRENIINNKEAIEGLDNIKNVRSDFYDVPDNTAMHWQIPSITAFHSVVSPSIMNFYKKTIDVTRDTSSELETLYYGLRSFLSCRYLFARIHSDFEKNDKPSMPGWKRIKSTAAFDIYENEHYVPMGYMFDKFISVKEYNDVDFMYRSEALLQAMVLSRRNLLLYSDITGYTEKDVDTLTGDYDNFDTKINEFTYGREEYFKHCEARKKSACQKFEFTKNGFEAELDNKGKDNLLFFSVPYDEGWSAYVNGKKTDIVKCDFGFMAVRVPGNTKSKIVFKYNIYGFDIGIIITSACGIMFFMYAALLMIFGRKKRKR